jgi:uncharacterized protein (TIGR02145 family)
MKKLMTIFGAIMFALFIFTGCGGGKDPVGNTVKIGTQVWMSENLNVSTFRNGDQIPEVKTDEEWFTAGKEGKPAWCYYDNNPAEEKRVGKIYNWYAVSDPRGLAPTGWHIASHSEWATLTDYLGSVGVAGKLKSKQGWEDNGNGTDETGFKALPCGGRSYKLALGDLLGWWWTSTAVDENEAWYRTIAYDNPEVQDGKYEKWAGMRVRCVKD